MTGKEISGVHGRGRRPAARIGAALTLALALVCTPGCNSPSSEASEAEPVFAVRLARISQGSRASGVLDEGPLATALAATWKRTGRFRPAPPGASDALRAVLWFDLRDAGDEGRVVELALSVDPPPGLGQGSGRGSRREPLEAFVSLERSPPLAEDVSEDLAMALELAFAVIDARVSLLAGERDRIAALIDAEDPELVLLALEWVAATGERGLADRVARQLGHPDARVAGAAVETLQRVGSARHVPMILAKLRLADAGHSHRVYDALGALGGADAEAFLRFAAENEDDPARRAAAQRALARAGARGRDRPGRDATAWASPTAPRSPLRGHRQ